MAERDSIPPGSYEREALARVETTVQRLEGAVHEAVVMLREMAVTARHIDDRSIGNQRVNEALRARIEALERWREGAMVKIAGIVAAGAFIAVAVVQPLVKSILTP